MQPDEALERAAAALHTAQRVLFVTGAGISAESGLPTYRGVAGLYTDASTEEGVPIEVALSGAFFEANPTTCWKYIRQIEEACRGATFNPAHSAIAKVEQRVDTVIVLTQNVDGFHAAAGSTDVIDIHGDIRVLKCTASSCQWNTTVESYDGLDALPRCPTCGEVVRPDVVLFGEMLPVPKVSRLQTEMAKGFDAVFSVGTSSLFPYIVAPVVEAAASGVETFEINPEETTISEVVTARMPMKAGEALPRILRLMES